MAESIKEKFDDAGHKISETASKVGHAVSEKTEEAVDWAKEKAHQVGHKVEEVAQKAEHKAASLKPKSAAKGSIADIKEHMEVYASCGTKVGKVDHVLGDEIKLTKNDSPDGQHHLIPTSMVDHVDSHVHLNQNHKQVQSHWQPA